MAQPVTEIKKSVESLIYSIEQSKSSDSIFTVNVKCPKNCPTTKLVLRGDPAHGQVQKVKCDGTLAQIEKPGTWIIPANSQNISWEIFIQYSNEIPLSDGKSIRSASSFLLSEGSSLPRLQDVSVPEYVKITIPRLTSIFPPLNTEGLIALPNAKNGFFFVLLNYSMVSLISSDNKMKLNYLLDNHHALLKLPDINIVMKGMQWLNSIISGIQPVEFTIGWLGLSLKYMGITGVTGSDVMLTNYPSDGEFPLGITSLVYTALHEGFHKLSVNSSERPTWAEESLASYFGIRAVQIALQNNPLTHALLERFLASGKNYREDLITINEKIERDESSDRGAFYTKGIAFWLAIDKLLQDKGDSLDKKLPALLKLKYEKNGAPINLSETLNLPKEAFENVRKTFLDNNSRPPHLVLAMHLKTQSFNSKSCIKWGDVKVHPESFTSKVLMKGLIMHDQQENRSKKIPNV